ncbi:hypothetical protein LWC35_11950 [Pseudonocardia kujensis]|uniref:hypothetical protein n=1 Tax=Pseudonocardia kujensis TaxID=1128675 RepID=UPI001E4138E7|nr:hypothetical protein [Pseudonocardia kujensis]MCE0763611.1 hypothetical protein [Pseudonocardia kujensis]
MSIVDRPDPPGPDLPGTSAGGGAATATPEARPAPATAPETAPGTAPAPLTAEERAELQRLRAEIAALRTAPPAPPPHRRPRGPFRWASLASAVLLVLGLLLVPVSVLAVWTHNQISDTDRFVATMSPVLQDPAVQTAVTGRVTQEIFAQVDVQQLANEAVDALAAQGLPAPIADRLHGLTGPLADGTRSFVQGKVQEVVSSPAFIAAGQQALTVTHQQLAAVLAGQSSAISVQGADAVLDLYPFIEAAKQRLVADGFALAAKIPPVHPTITLFPASILVRAQTLYHLLDVAATWLPWVTLAFLIGGVLLARNRRRATLVVGLAVMGTMLALAAGLLIVRGIVVGSVPEQGSAAAASAYDIIVRFVRAALRTLFVVGLVVALAAWVTGRSSAAVRIRAGLARGVASLRRGAINRRIAEGPVGPWVHDHLTLLRTALVVLAALVVVLTDRPSGWTILVVVLVLLVLLGIVQFLDQPRPTEPEPEPAPQAADPDDVRSG